MEIMDRLLTTVQDAERVVAERHYQGLAGTEWQARADAAMDRVWVAEKMVHILCTARMVDAAYTFVNILNDAMRRPPGDFDLWDYLSSGRAALLSAARDELGASAVG
jgi:hypothetical protein